MPTILLILASWVLLDVVLLGAWVGSRMLLEHRRRRLVVVADIGGRHFVVPNHPSLRKSA